MSLVSGRRVVTTAGTRVQLSTTSVAFERLTIQAVAPVVIGGPDVVAADATRGGVELALDGSITFQARLDGVDDLNQIWLDAETSGNAVTFIYSTAS